MNKDLKLAVFDFDSTLMDGETIDFLARDYGVENEVAAITKKAMNGELDFFESLTYRIRLLKGMKVKRVDEICANLPFVLGAKETITELKNIGLTVVCFSGGYKNATVPSKEKLGLDGEFSNILHSKRIKINYEGSNGSQKADDKDILKYYIVNNIEFIKEKLWLL